MSNHIFVEEHCALCNQREGEGDCLPLNRIIRIIFYSVMTAIMETGWSFPHWNEKAVYMANQVFLALDMVRSGALEVTIATPQGEETYYLKPGNSGMIGKYIDEAIAISGAGNYSITVTPARNMQTIIRNTIIRAAHDLYLDPPDNSYIETRAAQLIGELHAARLDR